MSTDGLALITEQFKAWDADGDGCISYEELKFVMTKISPTMTENDIDLLMKEIDENGDGEIQFEEFVHWIADPGSSKAMDEKGHFHDFDFKGILKPLFDLFDKDKGGTISNEEFMECHSILVNSVKMHPEASDQDSWMAGDFKAIDSNGDNEIDFQEFVTWQSDILKECGIPKHMLPGVMENITTALKSIFEIDEAVSRGMDQRKVSQALQESVDKIAENARKLFVKAGAEDAAANHWCDPPTGFSLPLLARKCASELGLGLGGLPQESTSSNKTSRRGSVRRGSMCRASTLTSMGQVKICIPDVNGGRSKPATRWFARVSRIDKGGAEEFFVYVFDASSGKLDWERTEDAAAFDAALNALHKEVRFFALLKTKGLMSPKVKFTGIKQAFEEAVAMDLLTEEAVDGYCQAMLELMLKEMGENDEIADLEATGEDPEEVAVERLNEVELPPIQVLVAMAEMGHIQVSKTVFDEISDEAQDCA